MVELATRIRAGTPVVDKPLPLLAKMSESLMTATAEMPFKELIAIPLAFPEKLLLSIMTVVPNTAVLPAVSILSPVPVLFCERTLRSTARSSRSRPSAARVCRRPHPSR